MVDYRPFNNLDPPRIASVWNRAKLGPGAAEGITPDAFEHVNFSQPYFDRNGLIVACDGERAVGFVHAGFGPDREGSALSREVGVICAVVVDPEFRRQGIGRELVRRAEEYLRAAGVSAILAGGAPPNDPFFVGLYGGVEPAGFLDSDPDAAPFFEALGYEAALRHGTFQRNLAEGGDPVNVQLMTIRRRTQLAVPQGPLRRPWWWQARFGKLDSIRFALVDKASEEPLASLTVVSLDFFLPKWQQRAVGLIDLLVGPEQRRQGCGQALVLEVCRRLRQEMFSLVEAHAADDDATTIAMLEAAGLERVDTGTVFSKAL